MEELERLLERQFRFLARQNGLKLVRQVRLFVNFIANDPRLLALASDLVRETDQALRELEAFDTALLPTLITYRHELVQQAPECNDAQAQRPNHGIRSMVEYENTLAFFDAYIAGTARPEGIPLEPHPNDDRSRLKTLVRILLGKIHDLEIGVDPITHMVDLEKQRDDLVPLKEKLHFLEAEHDHQFRMFLDIKYGHAGPAWHTVRLIFNEVNPRPVDDAVLSQDERQYRLERALHGPQLILNKALYDHYALTDEELEHVERVATFLKEQCERLFEELMLRIGLRRSHLALIDRYKYRCGWHEQASLRHLTRTSSTPEDDLARHLALWLFDQGRNPMTKMRAGNLEPDLLDPLAGVNLYIEAKQYKDSHGTRAYLIKGIGQMVDTMTRLHGAPYAVCEGYYVVYRRAGPRYIFPPNTHARDLHDSPYSG